MIVNKIEKKLQFPYVIKAQYEHRTAADTIYNTTVHKNKTNIALNVVNCLCHTLKDTNRPLGLKFQNLTAVVVMMEIEY